MPSGIVLKRASATSRWNAFQSSSWFCWHQKFVGAGVDVIY
eukprot:SAG31_NODE_14829_length_785_cov_1.489796_1_plen_40_part_10